MRHRFDDAQYCRRVGQRRQPVRQPASRERVGRGGSEQHAHDDQRCVRGDEHQPPAAATVEQADGKPDVGAGRGALPNDADVVAVRARRDDVTAGALEQVAADEQALPRWPWPAPDREDRRPGVRSDTRALPETRAVAIAPRRPARRYAARAKPRRARADARPPRRRQPCRAGVPCQRRR